MSSINQRILAYSALSMGFSMMSAAMGFYYVKVFLNIYKIEEHWFQMAQVLYLVWNAVNDPLFAYIQDTTNYKFTRTRREGILYGAPFFALSFLSFWFPWSAGTPPPWVTGLHLIVALCFYDTMFTFVGLLFCCLFTEISHEPSHRLKLVRWSQVGSLLGSSSVMFIEHMSGSLQHFGQFQIACVIVAGCSCVLMIYTGLNAHTEYDLRKMEDAENVKQTIEHEKTSNVSYWRLTWQVLREKSFISFVITNFLQEFHNSFLGSFAVIICDQLITADTVSPSVRSTFYGSLQMVSKLLVICGAPLVGRFGYFKVIRCNFIWKIFGGLALMLIGPGHPWILMLFILLDGCFTYGTFSLFNLPLSDVADADKAMYGRKHPISSVIFGTNALIVKPALSLSPMLVVAILNAYGYAELKNNTLGADQLSALKGVMFKLVCIYPIILGIIQFVAWSMYPLKDAMRTIYSKEIDPVPQR